MQLSEHLLIASAALSMHLPQREHTHARSTHSPPAPSKNGLSRIVSIATVQFLRSVVSFFFFFFPPADAERLIFQNDGL